MAEKTEIIWADRTWSPWEGCTKVGPGCDHCYAEARNARFSAGVNWGPGAPRRRRAASGWALPLRWNDEMAGQNRQETVFPSLCDPFDNEADPKDRADFWELIDRTPHLMWLLLTKRIGNVERMLPPIWNGMVPTNVAIGATMVNQVEVDRDWRKLWSLPTRRLFVSVEPMLGPVVLPPQLLARRPWVIAGGESGRGARPMHPDWIVALMKQCERAGVPFMFKQWGEYLPTYVHTIHHHGFVFNKVGKKKAGRRLHGATFDGFPNWIRR